MNPTPSKTPSGRDCRTILLAAVIAGFATPAHPHELSSVQALQQTSDALSEIAEHAIPGVVYVYVEKDFPGSEEEINPEWEEFLKRFFGPHYRRGFPHTQSGHGTGFVIRDDGYILTNHHIVDAADRVMVRLHDGREFEATLIGSDAKSEIAVIRVDARNLPVVPRGDSGKVKIGELVMAIGNPFGLTASVSVGVVSGLGRSHYGWGRLPLEIAAYENFIQTDAEINPGNSGGPLINIKGQVIGMNTAIFSRTGGSLGIGFAIPMAMAEKIIDQLIKSGRVSRGFLGVAIHDVTPEEAEFYELQNATGIIVDAVVEGSPAHEAGLKRGDIIVRLDGRPVASMNAFRNEIASMGPGADIELAIYRDGGVQHVSTRTGALPGEAEIAAVSAEPEGPLAMVGLTVRPITPDDAGGLDFAAEQGLLVQRVADDSTARAEGVQAGDVIVSINSREVTDLEDVRDALSAGANKKKVLLWVRNENGLKPVLLTRPAAESD